MTGALERAVLLLGPLEGRMMRAVWSGELHQPFTVRQMLRTMPALAYTTVMTTLGRLARKGMLVATPGGSQRAYLYEARWSPEEFLRESSRQAMQEFIRLYGDAGLAAFSTHLEHLTAAERARLRRLAGL